MKPKPLSIRHRFILWQASTLALAIWLLAGAVYIHLKVSREMEKPVKDLHAALVLNSEIEAAQEDMMMALARAHLRPQEESGREFHAAAGRLSELAQRYSRIHLSSEERRALEALRQLQAHLVDLASQNIGQQKTVLEAISQIAEARKVNLQIISALHNIDQIHLQRLEVSTAELRAYTTMLYLLLAAFSLFGVLALWQFRRMHQREIWEPLEDFRRMVMEIGRGNLDVTAEVPRSIELGTLVRGFLGMAGELREMRDSLEQKVRERTTKLEATQDELVQTAKLSSLGQLVSGVAHEVNNPLTSILGFSELALARQELDPRLRAQLQTIRDEAVRLKVLVANLNAFARHGPQRTARLDLRSALDRLADLRRYQLSAGNIELHYDRPAESVWVEGDRDRLVQVFFNLVLNAEQAIQSCHAKGDIWLACGTKGDYAWATVRDNGPGMPPEVREHIFEPFFTTRTVGQGAGLGLSISHGIIQQHHGTITVESAGGQGTLMRITLPAAEPPEEPGSEAAPEPAETPVADDGGAEPGLRALIIDDEPPITRLVEQFLESRGWKRVVLDDSRDVERAIHGQTFDLVICDLKMPGMSGLDILRLLRQKRPELAERFLLMTGDLAGAEQKESLQLAGVPVLRKPFTLARLAEACEALLSSRG